uniref:Uncharacterized protein n=1 Tax=Rhizophora mucronata TaxID=61149 RepID=A0A2P2J1G5_RHIMU
MQKVRPLCCKFQLFYLFPIRTETLSVLKDFSFECH